MTELPLWKYATAAPVPPPVTTKVSQHRFAHEPPKHDWPATPERHVAALGGADILTPEDTKDFNGACLKVLAFMRDGEWHAANDIITASGQREGLRRMRELRRLFHVERRRMAECRDFEYRLGEATPKAG